MLQYKTMSEITAETKNEGVKIYEVGYLLVPELAESAVAEEVGNLKALITDSLGGMEISSEMPRMIDLAYSMEKRLGQKKEFYSKAHFGWIKFELPSEKISEIKSALEKNNKIIRSLIIKTVRENTMAVKKVFTRSPEVSARKRADGEKEPSLPINEEELDKTIEELVIE